MSTKSLTHQDFLAPVNQSCVSLPPPPRSILPSCWDQSCPARLHSQNSLQLGVAVDWRLLLDLFRTGGPCRPFPVQSPAVGSGLCQAELIPFMRLLLLERNVL